MLTGVSCTERPPLFCGRITVTSCVWTKRISTGYSGYKSVEHRLWSGAFEICKQIFKEIWTVGKLQWKKHSAYFYGRNWFKYKPVLLVLAWTFVSFLNLPAVNVWFPTLWCCVGCGSQHSEVKRTRTGCIGVGEDSNQHTSPRWHHSLTLQVGQFHQVVKTKSEYLIHCCGVVKAWGCFKWKRLRVCQPGICPWMIVLFWNRCDLHNILIQTIGTLIVWPLLTKIVFI